MKVTGTEDTSQRTTTCPHCSKTYYNESTLRRHIRNGTCVPKRKSDEEREVNAIMAAMRRMVEENPAAYNDVRYNTLVRKLEEQNEEIKELRKDNQEMKKRLEELCTAISHGPQKTGQHTIHNVVNNGTINNGPVIVINSFGQEDASHITHQELMEWARDPAKGIIRLIERLHFDPSKPENHNVKLLSIKREELAVHENGEWTRKPAKPVIHDMMSQSTERLQVGVDWNGLSKESEQFYEEVSDDPSCARGKPVVHEILCVMDKYRKSNVLPGN